MFSVYLTPPIKGNRKVKKKCAIILLQNDTFKLLTLIDLKKPKDLIILELKRRLVVQRAQYVERCDQKPLG